MRAVNIVSLLGALFVPKNHPKIRVVFWLLGSSRLWYSNKDEKVPSYYVIS